MLRRSLIVAATSAAFAIAGTVPAEAQDRSDWPSSLVVATASQGGTYFIYGSGLASFIQESLGINASAEVTGGPVQNAVLVETGDAGVGLLTMGPAYEAWTGESPMAPGMEMKSMRALFPMYQTPFQIVTLKSSGIDEVSELNGKVVGVGPAGGTSDAYLPRMFETLGVAIDKRNGGAGDQASQIQDGLLDAFAFGAGVPISAFSQLEAQIEVNIFSFSEEEIAKLLETYPSLAAFTVPAGTYSTVADAQQTVAMWNFAVAHVDMPESLAYEITKLVMENNERMVQIHGSAVETLPENVQYNGFLPFHPGAVRYFEEKGIAIPDALKG